MQYTLVFTISIYSQIREKKKKVKNHAGKLSFKAGHILSMRGITAPPSNYPIFFLRTPFPGHK